MARNIGFFPRLEVDGDQILNLELVSRGKSSHMFSPDDRPHVYVGRYQDKPIIIKPYQSPMEKAIIQVVSALPLSLVLDYNIGFLMERVAEVDSVEEQLRKRELSAKDLGDMVGIFLGRLHLQGISYNDHLSDHVFSYPDRTLKATDFGASDFQPNARVVDISEGFEYLQKVVKPSQLIDAIETFKAAYTRIADARFWQEGVDRHLNHATKNDQARKILIQ
ncbi:MAG: hypothetical protein AABX33_04745 [Nanoarchaeota archaeon]